MATPIEEEDERRRFGEGGWSGSEPAPPAAPENGGIVKAFGRESPRSFLEALTDSKGMTSPQSAQGLGEQGGPEGGLGPSASGSGGAPPLRSEEAGPALPFVPPGKSRAEVEGWQPDPELGRLGGQAHPPGNMVEASPEEVEAAAAQGKAQGGGGGGAPAGPDYAGRLNQDFDDRLRAMYDEERARSNAGANVSEAIGRVAEEQRGAGQASIDEARSRGAAERAKIAEVEQMNRDYAEMKIDPDKAWHDKNVPQKIATVVGAMFAGLGGGVQGASNYVNDMVNRGIALQQQEIEQHYKAGMQAQNLLASFIRTSENEGEAVDKARAFTIGAAMTEVQKASVAAKSPIEQSQIRQLMADMKIARDGNLARLQAAKAAATAAAQPHGWLEVNPQDVVPVKGQAYMIMDKGYADDARTALSAYDRLEDAIKGGMESVRNRTLADRLDPTSGNVVQGTTNFTYAQEALAKLAGARGVPNNISKMVHEQLPDFGSRTVIPQKAEAQASEMLKLLDAARLHTLSVTGAMPVDVQTGAGQGKKAGQWTVYARPAQPRLQQAAQPQNDPWQNARPQQ